MNPIRIGTRGSQLALWQAQWVEAELRRQGFETQILEIGTSGDRDRSRPIAGLGVDGVFTKEIQGALLDGAIDLAVHSLKDLPTEKVEGLEFVASPPRGPFRDAFVSRMAASPDALPDGARIGTGSLRRKAQWLNLYGTRFPLVDIRGNVETRLRKLDAGHYDAIILAEAGLVRLGLQQQITFLLEPPIFLPAIGQGALGIEIRTRADPALRRAIDGLNDLSTYAAVTAERSLLRSLFGGCLAPIAAYCEVTLSSAASMTLSARVLSPDGRQQREVSQKIPIPFSHDADRLVETAVQLGRSVADELLAAGADKLLRP